jgi:FkbM family methyltransferase
MQPQLAGDVVRQGWVKPAVFHALPETVAKHAFNIICPDDTRLRRAGHTFWVEDDHTRLYLTSIHDATRFATTSPTDRLNEVIRKYELPGFCEIVPGEDVVDVGAFIGEFARAASETARQVYAIEPDVRSYKTAKRNLAQFRNVLVTNTLITHESTYVNYKLGVDGSESSISTPDFGPSRDVVEMMGIRLDEWGTNVDIDFLKVDVEGHELDVLGGLGDLRPRKISVDCSEPGPDGNIPFSQVEHLLRRAGYDTETDESSRYVYARY